MKNEDIDFDKIVKGPGIYIFRDKNKKALYIGRATELRSRVRSYFSSRLELDRGPLLPEALEKTTNIETIETDSVLDAYILEANFIKKYKPKYNVIDKDDKSFQFVGITKEDFPRVVIVRGREIELGTRKEEFSKIYGPFPKGTLLKEALKVLRKILPYRDSCNPYNPNSKTKRQRKCFRAELGLCPGVCSGDINKTTYKKRIREIGMFFEGKKKQLIKLLEKEMKMLAKERKFEEAEEIKKRIFSLTHIQDVALIKYEASTIDTTQFRIEAYDVAHTLGKDAVGVMVALIDGEFAYNEYRTFTIKESVPGDDIGALKEIISRRFKHFEWRLPSLIVIDGGKTHLNTAKSVLKDLDIRIPVVSVVKTEKHTPREILGLGNYKNIYEMESIRANGEAHRFALSNHKRKRTKSLLK